ncbi:MAG: PH domain-containing protein [Polyangiaceae bacterium]
MNQGPMQPGGPGPGQYGQQQMPPAQGAMAPAGAIAPAGVQAPGGEQVLFEGSPALIHSVGALILTILTLGMALVYFWFKRGGTNIKITSQRIVIDKGILSKKMEQLDLYRINDFTVERPLGQRIMGTGNIVIHTFDRTTPVVHLEALKADVVQLYETMRRAVETNKQLRGVRMVDYEGGVTG